MNRSRFLSLSFVFFVLFLFLKIYQHNKIFSLMCEKQRVERVRDKLEKEKDMLLVKLYQSRDQKLVYDKVKNEFGMDSLRPCQVLAVIATDASHSFDHTQRFTIES